MGAPVACRRAVRIVGLTAEEETGYRPKRAFFLFGVTLFRDGAQNLIVSNFLYITVRECVFAHGFSFPRLGAAV